MSYSDAALLRQLSSNSTPYRDPLALIEWGKLENRLRDCDAVRRASLACAARIPLEQLVSVYCCPLARFYELAGLTRGRFWRRLALKSPSRRTFVGQCLAPTRRLLLSYGLNVGL